MFFARLRTSGSKAGAKIVIKSETARLYANLFNKFFNCCFSECELLNLGCFIFNEKILTDNPNIHMRKFSMLLVAICVSVCALAQKPVVVVDYFTSPSCKESSVSALRSHVITGLSETGRVNLIDVESEAALVLESNRRSSELALEDQTARMGAMKTLGANYIITGVASKIGADKKSTDSGTTYYTGNVVYSLKVVNAEDGTLVGAETYTYADITAGNGSTSEEAIVATLQKTKRAMKTFVSKYFKVEGVLLEMGEMKGGKAKSCYISLGAASGVVKGQKCDVYEVKTIAGQTAKTLIGALAIEEVLADALSNCKFVSGAKEIVEAFQAGHDLVVVTKERRISSEKWVVF